MRWEEVGLGLGGFWGLPGVAYHDVYGAVSSPSLSVGEWQYRIPQAQAQRLWTAKKNLQEDTKAVSTLA